MEMPARDVGGVEEVWNGNHERILRESNHRDAVVHVVPVFLVRTRIFIKKTNQFLYTQLGTCAFSESKSCKRRGVCPTKRGVPVLTRHASLWRAPFFD